MEPVNWPDDLKRFVCGQYAKGSIDLFIAFKHERSNTASYASRQHKDGAGNAGEEL